MKPIVFSYKKHEDLRQAYKKVLAENAELKYENETLRKENTNLKIRLRIEDENTM